MHTGLQVDQETAQGGGWVGGERRDCHEEIRNTVRVYGTDGGD